MPGLKDISASFKTITVGEVALPVKGVSAIGIAYLLERFPVVAQLVTGNAAEINAATLFKLVPDAVAVIIACGCGNVNDPEAEAAAAALPIESQFDLLEAIIKLTMPGGVGPFVERLTKLVDQVAVHSTNIPDGTSQSQSKD